MKKHTTIIRTLAVALWPIICLLTIGYLEQHFRLMATRSFYPYQLALIPIYLLSGIVFAYNAFCNKDFLKLRSVLGAHIFAGASVVLFCVLRSLFYIGPNPIPLTRLLHGFILGAPLGVVYTILGYTVFLTIRALIAYKALNKC